MKLLIAIPALNEEQSIASTVQRCLDAVPTIIADAGVSAVEITVVSDGSTDRTVEIAQGFGPQIGVIVFPENKGYGAAIKEAWRQSDAELVSFLDADGTCDPLTFVPLCRAVLDGADVSLGSRVGPGSQMPLIRRVGNAMFAVLLSALSSAKVKDTASGMRVVRRTALPVLYPLPDGLHFTPSMSARVILSRQLKLVEIPMAYAEREGRSKLSVGRDGIRFFRTIIQAAVLYRPSRLLASGALLTAVCAALLLVPPATYYLSNRELAEWMIYRIVVGDLFLTATWLLLLGGYVSGRIVELALGLRTTGRGHALLQRFLGHRWFWLAPPALLIAGLSLVAGSFRQLVDDGATYEHWSRFLAFSMLVTLAVSLAVARLLDRFLVVVADRLRYESDARTAADIGR